MDGSLTDDFVSLADFENRWLILGEISKIWGSWAVVDGSLADGFLPMVDFENRWLAFGFLA